MIDINPETRSGAWTSDLVNEANLKYKDSLPAPIAVSYTHLRAHETD